MLTRTLDYAPTSAPARRWKIALWVAMTALALLGAVWVHRALEVRKQLRAAKLASAQSEMASAGVALDAFEMDAGRYPTTGEGLGALVRPPSGVAAWHGPYVRRALAADPWGTPYAYAERGSGYSGYTLTSAGPDRKFGTGDDVTTTVPQVAPMTARRPPGNLSPAP